MGYVGQSRSENSYDSIMNDELPLSWINRKVINKFLEKVKNEFTEEEFEFLLAQTVAMWKFIATKKVNAPWHHTGKAFRKTDHYPLIAIANALLENKDTLATEYQSFLNEKKADMANLAFGYVVVDEYSEFGRYCRYLGERPYIGVVKGSRLYYASTKEGYLYYYNLNANKVVSYSEYQTYAELVKAHPSYKGAKPALNFIIRLLTPKKKPAKKAKKKGA